MGIPLVAVPGAINTGKDIFSSIGGLFGSTQAFRDRDARKKQIEPYVWYWRRIDRALIPPNRLDEFESSLLSLKTWWESGEASALSSTLAHNTKWQQIVQDNNGSVQSVSAGNVQTPKPAAIDDGGSSPVSQAAAAVVEGNSFVLVASLIAAAGFYLFRR